MDWLIVALFGGLVGAGELINRYRDAPVRSLWNWAAAFYTVLNAGASVGALGLIYAYDWKFGGSTESATHWTRVLVAGFGAMGLFRTSLFTVRAGDRDIGVGPAAFLQVFLAAADRGVDRRGARSRATRVSVLMKGVDFTRAYSALPPYCLALMRNLPDEDQKKLDSALKLLEKEPAPDSIKVRLLGLELMNVVGEEVLKDAVDSLGAEISSPPGSAR